MSLSPSLGANRAHQVILTHWVRADSTICLEMQFGVYCTWT
jgi:hypothetical protein